MTNRKGASAMDAMLEQLWDSLLALLLGGGLGGGLYGGWRVYDHKRNGHDKGDRVNDTQCRLHAEKIAELAQEQAVQGVNIEHLRDGLVDIKSTMKDNHTETKLALNQVFTELRQKNGGH